MRLSRGNISRAVIAILESVLVLTLCVGCGKSTSNDSEPKQEEPVKEVSMFPGLYSGSIQEITEEDKLNFSEAHQLPALEQLTEAEQEKLIAPMQVMQRMEILGEQAGTYQTPEANWKKIYNNVYDQLDTQVKDVYMFTGTTASQLNQYMTEHAGKPCIIQIGEASLEVDETIRILSNVSLVGAEGQTVLQCSNENIDKVILLDQVQHAGVSRITIQGGCNYGIYVVSSTEFRIYACEISQMSRQGLAIMGDNDTFDIDSCDISQNGTGGVYIDGNVHQGIIENSKVSDNRGTNNLCAGIVLSSMKLGDLYSTEYFWIDETLMDKKDVANHIVFYGNEVADNNSSGIYSDGGFCNSYIGNHLHHNDKEGMCLDTGSFGNYLRENTFLANGGRLRMSDADLEYDFVLSYGRMADGGSKAKLPGLSLDNAAYNIIYNNQVQENYGSGIKMVRSAFRNTISENQIIDNNVGQSDKFHFFGIELGYAKADAPAIGLNFTPDYENLICNNEITGGHYAGLFLQKGCRGNTICNNHVVAGGKWTVEDHCKQGNDFHDNTMEGRVWR